MPRKPDGPRRVALTWPGKDRTLRAGGAPGQYSWSDEDHPAAALVPVPGHEQVGAPGSRNLLIRGDSGAALAALADDPVYAGAVKCVYIDPPFNTGRNFAQYDDSMEHAAWLSMMRDRLLLLHRLLADDGSIWVHLDDRQSHYTRVLLDEIFGIDNFVAHIAWEKNPAPRQSSIGISATVDPILVYRKSRAWRPNRRPVEAEDKSYPLSENGRRYRRQQLRKWGSGDRRQDAPSMFFPLTAPDGTQVTPVSGDGGDGIWRWSKAKIDRDAHLLDWVPSPGGWKVYTKDFQPADRVKTVPWGTVWTAEETGRNAEGKAEIRALFPDVHAFDTPKPERLLARILAIASDPGDLVLDCFAGSGTTAAVAHKMLRDWVTVEWSPSTYAQFTDARLRRVVAGTDPGGVTAAAGWHGGGGYRRAQVATTGDQGPEPGDGEGGEDPQVVLADLLAAESASDAERFQRLLSCPEGGQQSLFHQAS